jgi:hypothetical protein
MQNAQSANLSILSGVESGFDVVLNGSQVRLACWRSAVVNSGCASREESRICETTNLVRQAAERVLKKKTHH